MKVLLFNGSRREKGCTYTALSLIAKELEKAGIDTEIIYIGLNAVNGKLDALVKECAAKMKEADCFRKENTGRPFLRLVEQRIPADFRFLSEAYLGNNCFCICLVDLFFVPVYPVGSGVYSDIG